HSLPPTSTPLPYTTLFRSTLAQKKIEDAKEHVIDAIAETMDLYAVTPAAGRLYATMQLEEQMNLDQMREELGMSKPSMSTSVRRSEEHTSELQSRFDLVCR